MRERETTCSESVAMKERAGGQELEGNETSFLSSSVFFSPLLNFTSSFLFFFSLAPLLKTAESRALTYSWEGSRAEKR